MEMDKQPNGPGQFMFGTVTCDEESGWVPEEYKAAKPSDERELFIGLEPKSKRKSVVV